MAIELVPHSSIALKRYMADMSISVDELASKTTISKNKILQAIESDQKIFRITQLQKISEKLYIPTIYLSTNDFIFERDQPELQEFRNLEDFSELSYRDKALIQEVCSVRLDYLSVLDSLNEEPIKFNLELKGDSAIEDAQLIINYFGFHQKIKKIQSQDDYFKSWRLLVEEKSILVIDKPKESFGSDGMCLYFSEVPIITIFSTGQSYSRRLFTLIHELVHLGLRQSVFDGKLQQDNPIKLERYCDEVAGHVVAPLNVIESIYSSDLPLEENIMNIRKKIKASKAAIAIQLKIRGYINQKDLKNYLSDLEHRDADFSGGPKKESIALNYFGYNFVEKVMSAMWSEAIPATTARQMLKFTDKHTSESFNKLQSKVF
jgi:Zn-dependent peptidase ImmA (M78 family)